MSLLPGSTSSSFFSLISSHILSYNHICKSCIILVPSLALCPGLSPASPPYTFMSISSPYLLFFIPYPSPMPSFSTTTRSSLLSSLNPMPIASSTYNPIPSPTPASWDLNTAELVLELSRMKNSSNQLLKC